MIKKLLLIVIIIIFAFSPEVIGQCAMCRASVESNVAQSDVGIGSQLNVGILYLFFMPYLLLGAVAYFWFKNSKKNAKKKQITSNFKRKLSEMQAGRSF